MLRLIKRLFTGLIIIAIIGIAVNFETIYSRIESELEPVLTKTNSSEEPIRQSFIITQNQTKPEEIDQERIRNRIFERTNELRVQQGLSFLENNTVLIEVATIRAQETEERFSHTRPNEEPFHTVLDDRYNYQLAGENLAMGTYHLPEVEMADFLFEGWVESSGHYENMVEPDYKELGVGVHYDGENLYLVQIFGTPR